MAFAATSKMSVSRKISASDTMELLHYCNSSKDLLNVEEIKESITVGNSKSMMAIEVGSLKFRVCHLIGSGLDITLHEFIFVLELSINFYSITNRIA
jgi:hypothetical protein